MRPARRPGEVVTQRLTKPSLAKDLKTVRDAGLSVSSVERFPDGGYRICTVDAPSIDDDLASARLRRAARKVRGKREASSSEPA